MITWLALAAAMAVLPAEAKIGSQGYPELVEAWWRWVYQPRDGMRPTQDPNGSHCHVGQRGEVWFLAGGTGAGAVARRCVVPEGRHLFVPVYVVLEHSRPAHRRDCQALRATARAEADRELALSAQLNGEVLQPLRAASPDCFDAYADAVDEAPRPGLYAPATSDGWWLLLPPLPAGRHELVIEARRAGQDTARGRHDQQVYYLLDVGGDGKLPAEADPVREDASEPITL